MPFKCGNEVTVVYELPKSSYAPFLEEYDEEHEKDFKEVGPAKPIVGDFGIVNKRTKNGWLEIRFFRTNYLLTIRNGDHLQLSSTDLAKETKAKFSPVPNFFPSWNCFWESRYENKCFEKEKPALKIDNPVIVELDNEEKSKIYTRLSTSFNIENNTFEITLRMFYKKYEVIEFF